MRHGEPQARRRAARAPGAVGLLQLGVDFHGAHWQVLLEPGVLLDVRHRDAVPRVHRQHAADQVPALRAHLHTSGRLVSMAWKCRQAKPTPKLDVLKPRRCVNPKSHFDVAG